MSDLTGARVAITLWNGEQARGVILGELACAHHGTEYLIRLDHDAVANSGEFTDMVRYPTEKVNLLEN